MSNFSKANLEKLKVQLLAMPHTELVEALAEYAQSDINCWLHFEVVSSIAGTDAETALQGVAREIDRVFGDEDIPFSVDHEQATKYYHIQELIAKLLQHGFYEQATTAAERAFTYAEKISGVSWPDDFVDVCYRDIIVSWIRGCKGMELSAQEIARKLTALERHDNYSILVEVEKRHSAELGPEVVAAYLALKKPARP